MIEAHRYRFAAPLLDAYNGFLLRRAFARIRVAGLARLDTRGPAIAAPNHSCWWDGCVDLFLSRRVLRRRTLLMMGIEEMRKYKVFSSMGVFSVSPEEPLRSIRYAVRELLREPSLLWIYPQGEMLPARAALHVRDGALLIASASGAPVIPIARRYEFLRDDHPEMIVRVGEPLQGLRRGDGPRLESAMRELLARVDDDIARNDLSEYAPVLSGAETRSDQLQRLRRATS